MTEAYDTAGNKITPVGVMIDNTGANHRGDGPMQSIWTPAELADLKARDAIRAQRELDAPYLGWPEPKPMFTHKNPIVNEVAQFLWEAGL